MGRPGEDLIHVVHNWHDMTVFVLLGRTAHIYDSNLFARGFGWEVRRTESLGRSGSSLKGRR
jgi:hypothetical protein